MPLRYDPRRPGIAPVAACTATTRALQRRAKSVTDEMDALSRRSAASSIPALTRALSGPDDLSKVRSTGPHRRPAMSALGLPIGRLKGDQTIIVMIRLALSNAESLLFINSNSKTSLLFSGRCFRTILSPRLSLDLESPRLSFKRNLQESAIGTRQTNIVIAATTLTID